LDRTDPKRYAARETFFVTLECWEGLRKHFARGAAKKKPSNVTGNAPRARAKDL